MTERSTFSFFQISDALFDSPGALKSLELSPAKRKERTEEGFVALEKVLNTAREEQVDAVIIAGNLFHAESVTTSTVSRLQTLFARLKQMPIIVSPGDHDWWSDNSMYNQQAALALGMNKWPSNVYVFTKPDYSTIRLPSCPNVSITCRAFVDKLAPEFDSAKLGSLKRDESRIKVLIRPLPSYRHAGSKAVEPTIPSADDIEKYRFAYAAFSGLPSSRIIVNSEGRAVAGCSGTLFGQTEVETGPRAALRCSIEATEKGEIKTTVEQREFDQRRIVFALIDLSTVNPDLLTEKLRTAPMRAGARDNADIVIVKMTGTYPADRPPLVNLDEFRKRFYHVKFEDVSRPDYLQSVDSQSLYEQRFLQLVEEVRAASEPEKGTIIDDAMYFGLEALREGRILIRDAD